MGVTRKIVAVNKNGVKSEHDIGAKAANVIFEDGTDLEQYQTHSHSAASASASGFMTAADKSKLDGIAKNANNYIHPAEDGYMHLPAGGISGQILKKGSDGANIWANDITYSDATPTQSGLMTAADKSKLNDIALAEQGLFEFNCIGGNFSNQETAYLKIGKLVFINCNITIVPSDTEKNSIGLNRLPFVPISRVALAVSGADQPLQAATFANVDLLSISSISKLPLIQQSGDKIALTISGTYITS